MDFLAIKRSKRLQLTRNPIVVVLDPVPLPANQSRVALRYFIELKVQSSFQSSAFVSLPVQEASEKPIPANYTSSPGAFFEVQTRLDDQLQATPPVYGETGFAVCPDMTRQYYYVAERYNDDDLIDSVNSTTLWAFRGAIGMRHYSMYGDIFFTDVIGKEGRFLTWQPDNKFVREDQPERLYFLTNFEPDPVELHLRVKATYVDGTTEQFSSSIAKDVTPMTVYSVAVGHDCLSLGNKPKQVISYQVWISNEKLERLSEVRNFRIDRQPFESVRYIIFQNSLGGYDTIRCVGSPSESVAVQRQIVERFTDYNYLPTVSEVLINNVTGQRSITLNTGNWLNEEYRQYLEDLLLSEEFFIVDDQEFIPIVPNFSEILTHSVSEWPISRSLSFTLANPIGGFSRLPKVDVSSRPTGWTQYSESCELSANGIRTGRKIVNEIVKYFLDTGEYVRPLVTKANVPGTDGYVPPWESDDCKPSSTPFVNTVAQKKSTIKRNNCSAGRVGATWQMKIEAGKYGSEISQEDADQKALVALDAMDTQTNANQNGFCLLASNVRVGLINKAPDLGNGVFAPIPSLFLNDSQIISNHQNTNVVRWAETDYTAGTYTFDVRCIFGGAPTSQYKILLESKNRSSPVLSGGQTYRFANITIEYGDEPLIFSVVPA